MLSTMRKSWLLFTLFALITLSSALDLDGIEQYLHKGKRQVASGTGNSNPPSSEAPQTNPPSSEAPEPTPTPTSADDPSSNAPSQTPEPSSNAPASSAAPSTRGPNSTPAQTSAAPRTSRTPEVITSALVATSVQQYTTVFTTVSNGQSVEVTQTGSRTAIITTGSATITNSAQSGNGGGESGGLSESSKKIIGGVVGGVGGAILLGGIAIVCWRIWGRKKRVSEDDDDLIAGTGSALGDKSHSGSTNTPFQSNLEQYHNPGGRPNAAANF
ncbi:hypothetical protein K469DRAFT_338751 [Zopfia rhizophila CBS 207.26]|uniref:Mid2 domain-containing protein n=1 Tax=Zopfia rhizophila CBS 207.26 TaxID=1314779 RepID=A0A6A6DF28_9PEZI|nr:hypothetical protein K469DRAFT_338751 [Zopfia rhizophila CBS 207.26]